MIAGDDFSVAGSQRGKERARQFLTNGEINALAKARKSFRPVEGNTGCRAANLFVWQDELHFYLAAFNYSHAEEDFSVDFDLIGLRVKGSVEVKELWSGVSTQVASPMLIKLKPADAAIYKFPLRAAK
jgi:hypothetical protein